MTTVVHRVTLLVMMLFNENNTQYPIQQILSADTIIGDKFGRSVAINGDFAVIGADSDINNAVQSGSAYIFQRDSLNNIWSESAKLMPDDGNAGDQFGFDVSIYGNYALIGARNGAQSGSAYLFQRNQVNNNWYQKAKLLPDDGMAGDMFGESVSIYGDYAVIGSHLNDENGKDSGAAYIFQHDKINDTWVQKIKLTSNDIAAGDKFGAAVSMHQNGNKTFALIGANNNDQNGKNAGAAYIFECNSINSEWSQSKKLLAEDGGAGDKFGYAVSIYADDAVIGAYYDDDNGFKSGSAYVFGRDKAT
eukprot:262680_1